MVSEPVRSFRVLGTRDLVDMNDAAQERGYNRQLADTFVGNLDPRGQHVVFLELLHDEFDGEWRYCILAKVEGSMEPVDIQLDVAPELHNRGTYVTTGEAGRAKARQRKAGV